MHECKRYVNCEGFFNYHLQVCPSYYESLGSAAGYDTVLAGILWLLYYSLVDRLAQTELKPGAHEMEALGPAETFESAQQVGNVVAIKEVPDGMGGDMKAQGALAA